jgi:hypothetical protein
MEEKYLVRAKEGDQRGAGQTDVYWLTCDEQDVGEDIFWLVMKVSGFGI